MVVAARLVLVRNKSSRGFKRWARSFAIFIVSIGLVEGAAALLPRPMAQLSVLDPDVITVDFHSHTGASHDVSDRFTAEDNREWHRSGGFDLAYISDHVTFAGAMAASAGNPRLAGEGTSLLSAVEGRYHKIMSTIMLGLADGDTVLLNKRGNLLPGTPSSGRQPVTIVALPNRHLDSLSMSTLDSLPFLTGLELVDAAPRGLGQLDREEPEIRAIAAQLRLMLVSASNNHGWGRTVAAWNVMRIPGWRSLEPDSVGYLIEQPFRERDLAAVNIVQRNRPTLHGAALAGTLPVLAYLTLGSLTALERLIWLAWIVLALLLFRRARAAG